MTKPFSARRDSLPARSVVFAGARVCGLLIGALTTLVIARSLGSKSFGEFATASAVVGLVGAFGAWGADQFYLAGILSRGELVARLERLGLCVLLLGSVCGMALPNVERGTRQTTMLLALAAGMELGRSWWLLVPQREGRYLVRARRELIGKLSVGTATAAGVLLAGGAEQAAAGAVSAGLLLSAVTWRQRGRAIRLRRGQFRRGLKGGVPFALSSALYVAYVSIDVAMLGVLAGESEAGVYSVSYAAFAVAAAIPLAMNNEVLRPHLLRLRSVEPARSVPDWNSTVRTFLMLNLVTGLVAWGLMATAGGWLVAAVFGASYGPAAGLTVVLAVGLPFNFFNSWAGNLLIVHARVDMVVKAQGGLLALNVIGNLYMITNFGAFGAAIWTVVTEVAGTAIYCECVRRFKARDPFLEEGAT